MGRSREYTEFPRKKDGRVKETNYSFVLYPNSESYNYENNLEWLRNNSSFYVYAVHNQDTDEDGVIKDSHTHVFVRFSNPRYADKLAEQLGINYEALEFIKPDTEKGIIRYFAHVTKKAKEEKKHEYNWKEFESNKDLSKYFPSDTDKMSESQKIRMIRDFIRNYDGIIDGAIVNDFALDNNLWSEWRRSKNCLLDYIREHNHYVQLNGEEHFEYEQFLKYKKMYQEANGCPVGFSTIGNKYPI